MRYLEFEQWLDACICLQLKDWDTPAERESVIIAEEVYLLEWLYSLPMN